MVKFAKQLEVEAVPEWRDAYCNYKQLKKSLNSIKEQAQLRSNSGTEQGTSFHSLESPRLRPRLSFAITRRRTHVWNQHSDPLQVHVRTLADGTQVYETQLDVTSSPTPFETDFFAKLDQQLNKVNAFYRSKEAEFVQQGEVLKKQIEAFLEMKDTVDQSKGKSANAESRPQEGSKRGSSLGVQVPKPSQGSAAILMTPQNLQASAVPSPITLIVEPASGPQRSSASATSGGSAGGFPAPRPPLSSTLEVSAHHDPSPLYQMIMTIPRNNPRSTISALSQMVLDDVRQQLRRGSSDSKSDGSRKEVSFLKRKEMQYASKMLRTAYTEFYRGLTLLKGYGALNIVAFGKILKKYDKVTGRRSSPAYLQAVEASHFQSSDKVTKLMEQVEAIFISHFSGDDKRSAMRSLRPVRVAASHSVTFFLGLFTGCIIALIAAIVTILHVGGSYWNVTFQLPSYLASIFQVFSMLALIVLHIYLYGWNVYLWRKARINYAFIFEFAPGKELRYREILLVSSGLLTLFLGGMLAHLGAHYAVDRNNQSGNFYVDIIPLGVVAVFVLVLVFPFNIFYYSSRKFFLRCLVHLAMAPLYKVVLADFFLGDQLTSQVPMLRNMEFFCCYYLGGFFTKRDANVCLQNRIYIDLGYLVAMLPYYFRLMQCVRRWFEEGDRAHIANGLKYLSAMVAVATRMTYVRFGTDFWLLMMVLSSIVATLYGLYWDLVVDWGLLQRNSINPWLRDQLMLQNKAVYFLSMVANIILRLAWLLSLNHLQFSRGNRHFQDFFVAILEVLRRGMWNFFRLENEHLNNVGKYRAVKTVPLPFREVVAEEADE